MSLCLLKFGLSTGRAAAVTHTFHTWASSNGGKLGLEGIVAKRRDLPYCSGRSADWIKIKNPEAPAATRVIEWG
jgi:hypothetical protein